MPGTGQAPARRPRLSDEQTAGRVLAAALEALAGQGIGVGLEQLRFEDVIRAADVSRSSAYRRWPSREAFVEDVLVELARASDVPGLAPPIGAWVDELLAAAPDAPGTAGGRRDLAVELLRRTFQADVEGMVGSAQFRTYLALRAAFAGLASPALRDRVAASLAASERRAVARGAVVLRHGAALLGYRLPDPLVPGGFEAVSRAVGATSIGFVVAALTDPGLVTATRPIAAYGSSSPAPWSVPAYALTGLVLAHLEPDPDAAAPAPDALVAGLAALVAAGQAAADAAEETEGFGARVSGS